MRNKSQGESCLCLSRFKAHSQRLLSRSSLATALDAGLTGLEHDLVVSIVRAVPSVIRVVKSRNTRRANTVLRVTDVVTRTCYVLPKCSPVVTRTKVTQFLGVCVTFELPNVRPHILTRACYVLPKCSPVVTRTFVTQMFAFRKRIW